MKPRLAWAASGVWFAAALTVAGEQASTPTMSDAPKTIPAPFADWPANAQPADIGRRVAAYSFPAQFVVRAAGHNSQDALWMHALQLAALLKDDELRRKFIAPFNPVLAPGGERLVSQERHVDHSIFGVVPLEIYLQTGDARALALGKQLADRQWETPTPEGFTSERRLWIDDMYMITALQMQAWRATRDPVYLDRAALEMTAYLGLLQRENGLFHHGPNSPFFWGRGNGWVAAGMAELLRALPVDHPRRTLVMERYQKMMSILIPLQDSDGAWHQVLDRPDSYKEASCTAMFTYALVTGIRHGWLTGAAYADAARKGWLATANFVDASGAVRDVCVGTNQQDNLEFYLNRPRRPGEPHGQSAVLWCAVALLRPEPSPPVQNR